MMSKIIKPQLFCTRKKEFGKILPVKNIICYPVKPTGGLWTSTYTPNDEYPSAWVKWCIKEQPEWIKDINFFLLIPKENVNVFIINSFDDLKYLCERFIWPKADSISDVKIFAPLDWEEIAEYYDGVMLTEKGERETRHSYPSLYGWDCESTLWFRNVFKEIKKIKWRKLDGTN